MSKKNEDFFVEKKAWSKVKDELLGCYLKPYFSKIIHTRKPIVYIDCFAGKGMFDDGNPGSPIIALQIIDECKKATTAGSSNIEVALIELNYAKELGANVKGYNNIVIVPGRYEDNIENLLKGKQDWNVFLYIDPYGIKGLRHTLFTRFANEFNSIEMLINMNSFGFIREACNALGAKYNIEDIFDDLIEYDTSIMDPSEKSINDLNEIAGGDYWQKIIEKYKNKEIDGYQAEEEFAKQYCQKLRESFRFVLNMPLRIKKRQRPKYRLIHVTNHRDGCLLMVDNICNRWESLQDIQTGGQISFLAETIDNNYICESDIQKKVEEFFIQYKNFVSLNDAIAGFFMKYGPICNTGTIKKDLKFLEKEGKISLLRNPSITPKGKPTTFMDEGKDKTISIRWII